MNKWMNEWMNECMNECMNGRRNERMNQWMKGSMNKWTNEFCRPHRPKVFWPCQVFTILMWNGALATVGCAFCRPHRPKVLRSWQLLTIFMWSRALGKVSRTFCRPLLQIEACNRGNRGLLRRPRKPLLPKKQREWFQAGIHAFPTWWCAWHDDMMMWSTWWWECWPWQSSVTRKFSN
jgi:hypothetical protein